MTNNANSTSIKPSASKQAEEVLSSQGEGLQFEPELERLWETRQSQQTLSDKRISLIFSALIASLLCIVDLFVLPVDHWEMLQIRVIPILAFICLYLLGHIKYALPHINLATVFAVTVLHITLLVGLVEGIRHETMFYQHSPLISFVVLCLVLRTPFNYVMPFSMAFWFCSILCIHFFTPLSLHQFLELFVVHSSCALVAIAGNYRQESTLRENFLKDLLLQEKTFRKEGSTKHDSFSSDSPTNKEEQNAAIPKENTDSKADTEHFSYTEEMDSSPECRLIDYHQFEEALKLDWNKALIEGSRISLILAQIDEFDSYLEKYGTSQADTSLAAIALATRACTANAHDSVICCNDSSLAIILTNTDETLTTLTANQILHEIEKLQLEHRGKSTDEVMTVSVGFTSAEPGAVSGVQQIIHQADRALYVAVNSGKKIAVNFTDLEEIAETASIK